jgi:hypothetical protein
MSTLSFWVDESEKGSLLAVGGVLVEWDEVGKVVKGWRTMKVNLGLDQAAEVKWSLPSGHRTRKALELSNRSTRDLSAKAVDYLASSAMSLVVVVMFEQRQTSWWKSIWAKASVRDFYCEGLRYALQRVAEEVVETGASGAIVVCDTPELGTKEFTSGSIRRGRKAVEKAFAEWYAAGVGVGPGKQQHSGPLKDAEFHPSILIGDATYHDMLQMADVVVGATRDWVASVNDGKPDPWLTQQVRTLSSKFRARHGQPSFWGDGLVLWPWQNKLWETLKRSLQ